MIERGPTDKEWSAILEILHRDHSRVTSEVEQLIRQRIDAAAARYRDGLPFADQMRGAAKKRDQWKVIHDKTVALIQLVSAVERWRAPLWEIDEPEEKTRVLDSLQDLSSHARYAAEDYAVVGLSPLERLNSDLVNIWTDLLQQDYGWSEGGPAVRFFQAALSLITGKSPASTTVRDILKREKDRRLLTAG